MGELATSPPPVVSVNTGTDAAKGGLLQEDRAGVPPAQIPARSRRRAPRGDDDEAADLTREASLRRSRRGGRSRRDKKQPPKPPPQQEKKTILKRLSPADLAALAAHPQQVAVPWEYEVEAQLRRQREWYLLHTAAPDPAYFPLALDPVEDWAPAPRCRECEAAAEALRQPAFHWCVRDAVTVGFRSPVGPIQRPPKKNASSFLGMSVY